MPYEEGEKKIKPGDLVCATKSDDVLIDPEECGVVERVDEKIEVVFNFQTPYMRPGEFVSASGGPVRLIDREKIGPARERVTQEFWKFRHGIPGANRGENFRREVDVFETDLTE